MAPRLGAETAEPARDLVLITIDTLRADAVGFAGNRLVETPLLDRLAAGGRVFTDAHAHAPTTLSSHASILTGLYPYQHGARENGGFELADRYPTLATILREAGFATGAFVAAYPLDSSFGLDRGFDRYDDEVGGSASIDQFRYPERAGDDVIARALDWWRSQEGRRRFLWVHLFEPHAPYLPTGELPARLAERPYLGEVSTADVYLRPLVGPLLDDPERRTLILFTSDHGESLGQHGELTHGLFAYEATLKVPLVVWGRGVEPARDDRLARHVDLLPTALDGLGIGSAARGPGSSLLRPAPAAIRSYFEALSGTLNYGWAPLRGQMRKGWKLIELPIPELYDLGTDPNERTNLYREDHEAVAELTALLPEESVWPPQRAELAAEESEALRSLGYLAGPAERRETYGVGDDPKTLIGLDRALSRVAVLDHQGRYDEAIELVRGVLEARPGIPAAQSYLSILLLKTGRYDEAVELMRWVLDHGTNRLETGVQLALTLIQLKRGAEALSVIEPLAREADNDPRILNPYALALIELERWAEAKTTLEAALELEPDDARTYDNLAVLHLRQGRYASAERYARRSTELLPGRAGAWNNLAMAEAGQERYGEALADWRRALEIEPNNLDSLLNVGITSAQLGRSAEAIESLERFLALAPVEAYGSDVLRARRLLDLLADAGSASG